MSYIWSADNARAMLLMDTISRISRNSYFHFVNSFDFWASLISPSRIADNYPETPGHTTRPAEPASRSPGSLSGGWSFAVPLRIGCESLRNLLSAAGRTISA
jgi:hypothetical protein